MMDNAVVGQRDTVGKTFTLPGQGRGDWLLRLFNTKRVELSFGDSSSGESFGRLDGHAYVRLFDFRSGEAPVLEAPGIPPDVMHIRADRDESALDVVVGGYADGYGVGRGVNGAGHGVVNGYEGMGRARSLGLSESGYVGDPTSGDNGRAGYLGHLDAEPYLAGGGNRGCISDIRCVQPGRYAGVNEGVFADVGRLGDRSAGLLDNERRRAIGPFPLRYPRSTNGYAGAAGSVRVRPIVGLTATGVVGARSSESGFQSVEDDDTASSAMRVRVGKDVCLEVISGTEAVRHAGLDVNDLSDASLRGVRRGGCVSLGFVDSPVCEIALCKACSACRASTKLLSRMAAFGSLPSFAPTENDHVTRYEVMGAVKEKM
ncbi:hypothetical protein DENSPDRAFT_908735 [Dentipellis sp. KUC8613]|nr:hypothetical protein DENSPDRAFT_908735 [Dentipellis sp. KUC8613]